MEEKNDKTKNKQMGKYYTKYYHDVGPDIYYKADYRKGPCTKIYNIYWWKHRNRNSGHFQIGTDLFEYYEKFMVELTEDDYVRLYTKYYNLRNYYKKPGCIYKTGFKHDNKPPFIWRYRMWKYKYNLI